jgi:TRAP-type C4-dicarboxylate transport system permease small subunit
MTVLRSIDTSSNADTNFRVWLPFVDPDTPAWLRPLAVALRWINVGALVLAMLALLVASCVLTYSVFSRYFLQASTDWQDEAAVFCLVGATFLCGAYVQSLRGHVGIEAIASVLPRATNRIRLILVDIVCLAFCALFSWKSWTLLHEAWIDGQTTSSSWAPPLWIPYGLMSLGMSFLTAQLLVQVITRINVLRKRGSGSNTKTSNQGTVP